MNQHMERVLLLTRVPLFSNLRTDQLSRLAPLLEPVAWPKGARIFDIGDMGTEIYIITEGRVAISVEPDPTSQVYINEFKNGDSLGELALIDNQPRSATATVLEDTRAFALDKEKLYGLLMSYPELSIGMLWALSQRLRAMSPLLLKKDKK